MLIQFVVTINENCIEVKYLLYYQNIGFRDNPILFYKNSVCMPRSFTGTKTNVCFRIAKNLLYYFHLFYKLKNCVIWHSLTNKKTHRYLNKKKKIKIYYCLLYYLKILMVYIKNIDGYKNIYTESYNLQP